VSFYQIGNRFPLLVLATQAQEDVLEPWKQGALARMGFVLGLTLIIGLVGLRLVHEFALGQRMAASLAAKEADFRLLAEESSDLVTRLDTEERVLYASPSATRVLGWKPAQLVGTSALAGINPEDLPRVRQAIAALKSGDLNEARILYRNRHREKGEIWIETSARVTRRSDSGTIDGVVALSRDMTENQDLQAKLTALAATDGLTGIANRRCFDEHLEREWSRARREGSPLSLLMIDIDHFKAFNDRFGHPEGDRCLRAVACILAGQARRPADLAARYGGEEFAILMPSTDAEGCRQIGERILDSVAELSFEDSAHRFSHRVTVSLGGATFQPNSTAKLDQHYLVSAADRALYAAKAAGRNQIVMAGNVIGWPLKNARDH